MDLCRLALKSWKSVRGQNVSQTSVLDMEGLQEVRY